MKLKKSDLQKIIREELKNLHEAEAVNKDNYTVEELSLIHISEPTRPY